MKDQDEEMGQWYMRHLAMIKEPPQMWKPPLIPWFSWAHVAADWRRYMRNRAENRERKHWNHVNDTEAALKEKIGLVIKGHNAKMQAKRRVT